ncbi:related to polyketide synthase [Cephalotrichum gorgonifer]|uniref:Related to polyketide synthase n=1 Tax=Cephalotrichum gorgonifer TaxID=2041049 RepID=A0AAE8MTM9_9PEZI|nr:related to polyketide synthase [Cephalotrichum gorgonifer]
MDGENPEIVQPPSPSHPPSAIPLILVHDGGGTTFAYHCLPDLSRPVYGIFNPRFDTGGVWEGGIREMAALYASMIRSLVSSASFPRRHLTRAYGHSSGGAILLGGWSLGGALSLEITSLLGPMVKGIIIIDTPYPRAPSASAPPLYRTLAPLSPDATRSQRRARECIKNAPALLRGWTPPDEESPPAILIKAREAVPVWAPEDGKVSPVDVSRVDDFLGWKGYAGGRVRSVTAVSGHHFNIFEWENIDETGRAIEAACWALERG